MATVKLALAELSIEEKVQLATNRITNWSHPSPLEVSSVSWPPARSDRRRQRPIKPVLNWTADFNPPAKRNAQEPRMD